MTTDALVRGLAFVRALGSHVVDEELLLAVFCVARLPHGDRAFMIRALVENRFQLHTADWRRPEAVLDWQEYRRLVGLAEVALVQEHANHNATAWLARAS